MVFGFQLFFQIHTFSYKIVFMKPKPQFFALSNAHFDLIATFFTTFYLIYLN